MRREEQIQHCDRAGQIWRRRRQLRGTLDRADVGVARHQLRSPCALHERIAAGEDANRQYRGATAGRRSRGNGPIVRKFKELHALSITTAKAMGPLALSGIIFALTLGGILLGTLLRRTLPKHHLSEEAKNTGGLGVGLIATIAARVLGLLIAAERGSFDPQNTQVKQITADLILLDKILAQYGPEARPIREQMRSSVGPFTDRLWHEKQIATGAPFETNAAAEKGYLAFHKISPQDD